MNEPLDFGTRTCLICQEVIVTSRFGNHVLDHGSIQVTSQWPGGIYGFIAELRNSIRQSMRVARNNPALLENLRNALVELYQLEQRARKLDLTSR